MYQPKRRVNNTNLKKETRSPQKNESNVSNPSQNYRNYISNQYGPEIIAEWRIIKYVNVKTTKNMENEGPYIYLPNNTDHKDCISFLRRIPLDFSLLCLEFLV